MAFPLWLLGLFGVGLYALTKESQGPAAPTPAGGAAAPPGLPPSPPLGSAVPDAQGVSRIDPQLAAYFLAQLAQKSALGSGAERVLGPAGAGENAAAWVAGQVAQGRVVLCTTGEDPGRLLAVSPGQEAQYASGPSPVWTVLASPQGLASPGGLPGSLGGLGGLLGGLGLPTPTPTPMPPFGGPAPATGDPYAMPGAGLGLTRADFVQDPSGLVVVRADRLPVALGMLAQQVAKADLGLPPGVTPPAGADMRVLWAGPLAGDNAASWVAASVAAGKTVLVNGVNYAGRLVMALQGGEAYAAPGGDWAILARPAAIGQLPQIFGGTPPVPPAPPQPLPPPGLPNLPPPGVDPFAELSAAERSNVMAAIATNDPVRMRQMADAVQSRSAAAAAALRKGATDAENARKLTAIAEGRVFTIREGDLASTVAEWYFGDASKWRALAKYNGFPILAGGKLRNQDWHGGAQIELMPGARVEKGLPPLSAGARKVPPPAPAPAPAPTPPPVVVASNDPTDPNSPNFNPTL